MYGTDVAYVHDRGFTDLAEHASVAITDLLHRAGIRAGQIVELGCGSGVTAARLSQAGYDVLGIDGSRPMLRLARRRAPLARFRHASLLDVAIPDCKAVISIGECLCYRESRRSGTRRLRALFGRVRRALEPTGLFVFDAIEPGAAGSGTTHFSCGPDWAVGAIASESRDRQWLTREITGFRKRGGGYRRSRETHHVQLYHASWIATELRSAGFRVRVSRRYGTHRLAPRRAVLIARRPKT